MMQAVWVVGGPAGWVAALIAARLIARGKIEASRWRRPADFDDFFDMDTQARWDAKARSGLS
jgi:hypothetical protein